MFKVKEHVLEIVDISRPLNNPLFTRHDAVIWRFHSDEQGLLAILRQLYIKKCGQQFAFWMTAIGMDNLTALFRNS